MKIVECIIVKVVIESDLNFLEVEKVCDCLCYDVAGLGWEL